MPSKARTVKEYLDGLDVEQRKTVTALRNVIRKNLSDGFKEGIQYGMIGYSVPHKLYPAGYHSDASQPLPFISLAVQKDYVALYHMGLYANKQLLAWFQAEYVRLTKKKVDMGKSCIRFKDPEKIPFELIGELASKMTVDDWIQFYESTLKK